MKVMIFTLGWDEKFQIRSLIRNDVKQDAKVIVILTEPMDDKSKAANERLKKFVKEYIPQSTYEEITIDPLNFSQSIRKIVSILKKVDGDIIMNLSGGMRIAIIEALTAAIISGKNIKIEIELENFGGVVETHTRFYTSYNLSEDGKMILKKSLDGRTLDQLVEELEKPKPTVYRKIRELLDKGLLIEDRSGRKIVYRTSEIGKQLIKVLD